jgi:aryl-alcohol dehydrogenase-like predicted oxidoreductase
MQTIKLGDKQVSRIALGCMGMQVGPAQPQRLRAEYEATLRAALDAGITALDTAEVYGPYENERFLGEVLRDTLTNPRERARISLATKFGFLMDEKGHIRGACGTPKNARAALEGSLLRLGLEYVDIYYLHRKDPEVPIEESVGAMADLVREGKARAIGLSEVSGDTLKRAHSTYKIAALQSEYSLLERHVEQRILPMCRELGVAFVAYSPLGRGLLTGASKPAEAYGKRDTRRMLPRFQGENYASNQMRLAPFFAFAKERGLAPATVALAWLKAQAGVVPLFGTSRRGGLAQNLAALELALDDETVAALSAMMPAGIAIGERYHPGAMRLIDR